MFHDVFFPQFYRSLLFPFFVFSLIEVVVQTTFNFKIIIEKKRGECGNVFSILLSMKSQPFQMYKQERDDNKSLIKFNWIALVRFIKGS